MAGFTLKIGADASAYKNELEKMRGQTKAFSSKIGGIMKGAFALLSVGALRSIADEFVEIGMAADRLNVDVSEFSKIAQAASAYKIPVDQLADAMKDLSVKITEASLEPDGTWGKLFKQMDFDVTGAKLKDSNKQITMFIEALSKVPQERVGFFLDEFGDAMFNIGPLARAAGKDIKSFTDQYKGFSSEEIKSLQAGDAAWRKITLFLKMQTLPILTQIAGTIEGLTMFFENPKRFFEERKKRMEKNNQKKIQQMAFGNSGASLRLKANMRQDERANIVAEANKSQIPLVVFPSEAIKSLKAIEENTKEKLNKPPQPEQ